MNRIIGCWEAGPGALTGDKFKRTKTLAIDSGLISKEQARDAKKKADDEKPEPAEIAKDIMAKHAFLTFSDTGEILKYDANPGVYSTGAASLIGQLVEQDLETEDTAATIHFVKEVQGHVQRKTYTSRDAFDSAPYILNLKNGLYDLRTGTLSPHTPSYPSLVQLPVAFDPSTQCQAILKFLSETTWPEDRDVLQEYTGVILWKSPLQRALLLNGTGANGKSVFVNLLKALVGPANIVARSLQELEINKFAKADLYGKLVNLYADLPQTALKSTGIFKMLTGGDPVTAEHKFQQPFTFVPSAKHVYSCNRIPKAPDDLDAFFRRWLIVTFPYQFLGEKDNRSLLSELTTDIELSGFLNWALAGLERLRANGWRFSEARSIEQVRDLWVRGSDPVKAFVMDWCITGPDQTVAKADLYAAFMEYCRKNGLPGLTNTAFYRELPLACPVTSEKPSKQTGVRVHTYRGLAVKPESERTEVSEDGQAKL
jgi:putative DNA primase/helicase